jgi:HSP20 family molecular chaperone IbpA
VAKRILSADADPKIANGNGQTGCDLTSQPQHEVFEIRLCSFTPTADLQRAARAYGVSARLPGFDEENVTAAGGFRVRETTQ